VAPHEKNPASHEKSGPKYEKAWYNKAITVQGGNSMSKISEKTLTAYAAYLSSEEYSKATVQKYLHSIKSLSSWLGDRELTRETASQWKSELLRRGYAPVSVNTALSALNSLLGFLGEKECAVKYVKVQRKLFRDKGRELTREEYEKLVETAREQGKTRLALLLETICSAGIRVSEVRYITVEAAEQGKAEISLKGKVRTILLPGKLCRKLRKYAGKQKIASGEIFLTGSGKSISRTQIWAEMKALCKKAGVEPGKVFPHNLRHLFARVFYRACRDIARLADVLGHSSVETTRIYLVTTGEEHARQLERLRLV